MFCDELQERAIRRTYAVGLVFRVFRQTPDLRLLAADAADQSRAGRPCSRDIVALVTFDDP